MAFPPITPLPISTSGLKPDAEGETFNAGYSEIDANFDILEDVDLSTFWDGAAFSVPGAAVPGNGHIIEDEGLSLAQKSILNFIGAAVNVVSGATKTEVTLNAAKYAFNIEALGAAKTLTDASPNVQSIDPNGAARDINLPAEAVTNPFFVIRNTGAGAFDLTVKDDSPATIATIANDEVAIFYSDGVEWFVFSGGGGGAGDMTAAVYDPAGITEQLVGLVASQILTNKTLTSAVLNIQVTGTAILDEDDMASDSAVKVSTQQAIKAFGDGISARINPVKILQPTPPSSDGALIGYRPGGSTPAEQFQMWRFSDSTTQYMDFKCVLTGYNGGGLTFTLPWSAPTATTGDLQWEIAIRAIPDDAEDLDASHAYDYNLVVDTAPNVSGEVSYPEISFTDGADMDGLADGEMFFLRIRRNTAGTNTLAEEGELYMPIPRETA